MWSQAAGCECISHNMHACGEMQNSTACPGSEWRLNMPGVLLFLVCITNSRQTPLKKKSLHIVSEGLPTQPRFAYLYIVQLIKKEIKNMLSPKLLI